ncbi:MAG TPA: phenylalanine--tRNA ligase subunit beta [Acidobacteriota bacterium]|jgi:phenylalanyl-tRNA synthetase beta chain
MKISYLWLRDYIELDASPEELRDALSSVGLVVESLSSIEDDVVLNIEIPSNRPDCLNHGGIARELSAIYDRDLKPPSPAQQTGSEKFSIRIEDPDLCRRYSGQVIRGVKIKSSPPWMQKRLAAVGQRPINNIVDVTNYVLLELGHPLHAFDLDRLKGPEIIVRRGRAGEVLRTLDGVERKLDHQKLVIADRENAVALAGIMGGESSEISAASTNLLIESAYFDPVCIGRAARDYQMRTEASHRFERGADLAATVLALQRCVELILELAGGSAATGVIDVFPKPAGPLFVSVRKERMKLYAATEVPDKFVVSTLQRLGFKVEASGRKGWKAQVPSHRIDISLEEDLIEEAVRHYGYDKIPSSLPAWRGKGDLLPETRRRLSLAQLFRSIGYSEAMNWTFMDPQIHAAFGYEQLPVALKNPLSEDASQLRTHLIPNLALAARHNQNHGQDSIRLFEIGKTFSRSSAGETVEREHAAWVAMGPQGRKYWTQIEDPLNYFYMKGVLEQISHALSAEVPELKSASLPFLNPAQSADIIEGGRVVGCIGCLHPQLQESLKIQDDLFLGEVDLGALEGRTQRALLYVPIGRFPRVFRDFSFLVDQTVPFAELRQYISRQKIEDLRQVELIDLYRGSRLPPGKISLAIRLFFENPERTLTDEEVEAARDQIVEGLRREFGVIPR